MNQLNALPSGTPGASARRTSWWRKAAILLGLVFTGAMTAQAQTTLIDPAAGGGFELGATFPLNGWTLSNSASVNQYTLGTLFATAPFVNRSAYNTNDGGVTANYTNTAGTLNYFYRDVSVPAGETAITLTFTWAGGGETGWDMVQVFTAPTSVVPVGTTSYPGNGDTNVPAGIAGATFVGKVNFSTPTVTSPNTATFTLPGSLAGTTVRLIFGWKSDTSVGTNPSVAIDNISLVSAMPTPATCPTTFVPADLATGILTNQVLSWSGAGGAPAPTYNVYFSTNSALVAAQDVSVRVLTGTAATTYAPVMGYSTTYYWMVVPSNIGGGPASCVVNSFTTAAEQNFTASALGGLWNDPATWVGGVVPAAGNDITIPAGSTVTINQAVDYRNWTIDGTLHWGASTFNLTSTGNFTINATGRFFPYTSGGTGQTIQFLGDFINNGYTNLMVSAMQFGGSGAQTLGGTGSFVGTGAKGIVNSIFKQGNGTLTINTTMPLVARGSVIPLMGTINTNGLLEVDNAVGQAGQASNNRLETIVITAMGSLLPAAPSITGTWPSGTTGLWVASGAGTTNNKVVVPGGNVYLVVSPGGTLDPSTPPTHTSGIVNNGTAPLLWLGPVGTLGTGFQATTSVAVGTQVWYGGNLYTCTVAGIPSATAPPVHVSGTAVSGAATFAYVGTPAQVTVNYDGATQTVRSLSFVNQGSGYHTTPPNAFLTASGTNPTAAGLVIPAFAGATTFLAQKQATSSITGALPINNSTGVTAVVPGGSFGRYSAAPAIGIGGPTGINFVTAQGTGYTAAPTVTFTGGTLLSGTNTFATQVAQGKILSIVLTTSALYSVPPTGISIVGVGAGAAAALPANCWATATTNMNANGQVVSFSVTNAGFGYIIAPTCGLTAAVAGEAAAAVPVARVGLYNLTLANFAGANINGVTPVPVNAPHTETGTGSLWPTNRSLNVLSMATGNQGLAVTGGNLTLTAATGPLVLTAGALNMGGSTLVFSNPTFLGQNSATASWVENGAVELNGISTATVARNFPFRAGNTFIGSVRLSIGTGSLGTGSDITRIKVTQLGAPSGTTPAPVGNMIGNRSYQVDILAGTIYGTSPTMQLAFESFDNLISDNPSLYMAQSLTGITGGWNVVSTTTGTGSLPATGSRTSATAAPGPIVFAGATWFGFSSNFVPPAPLAFNVVRTTGNLYQSISSAPGGDGTGTLSLASGDEGVQIVPFPGGMNFMYQGSPCTAFAIHTNGYISLQNGLYTPPAFSSSWDNTLAAGGLAGVSDVTKRNVLAPFYSDLNKASPVIWYKFVGNIATIEWYNTTFFGLAGPQMYFQIVLDGNDNSITYNYGDMQLFNGTQNIRYSYTCGINGAFIQVPAAAGQIFQQQYANTALFSHEYSNASNWGANGLAAGPEPRSRIKFTPGVYTPPAPPGTAPPSNDEPAGAITRPSLLSFPSNIAWETGTNTTNLYSTRYATSTVAPAPCSPSTGAAAKDSWFKFTATAANVTVRIYASGGFIPRVEVYNNALTTQVSCAVGTQGLQANATMTGLTIGAQYYVRVYHDRVGTTALATATVGGGAVTGLTVTTPGTNYSVPQQAFGYNGSNQGPIVIFSGGGATSAAGALTNPTSPSQVIATLVTSNLGFHGGAGYTSAPTVTIDSPDWGITGEFGIVVFAPVLNDECTGAFTIASGLGCTPTVGTTGGATGSPQAACTGIPDDDVWYSFVAAAPNTQVSVVSDANFDAAVQVFSGSCGTPVSIACVNSTFLGGTENANLTGLTTGNTYFVRIYHAGNLGGSSAFTICVNHAPSCATVIAPTNGSTVATTTPTLSWAGSSPIGASGYNVYLEQVNPPTIVVSANQPGLTYTPGAALAVGTWYWRIEPINGPAVNTTCAVSSFIVPSCFAPTSVVVTAASATQTNVAFTCTGCTGTYLVEYGAPGFTPGTAGTAGVGGTVVPGGSSPIAVTGLTGGQAYQIYVRQVCTPGSDYSVNAGPVSFTAPEDLCGLNFYDNGGVGGAYTNNANVVRTFCPTNVGGTVIATFNSFNTESGWDPLYVFDGPSISSPQIASGNGVPAGNNVYGTGGWWGTTIPSPITSTHASGCLTFAFTSDGSVTLAGWDASVICPAPSACTVPTPVTASAVTSNSASISWTCSGCVGPYIIEYGAPGFVPGTGNAAGVGGTIVAATSSPWPLTGLSAGTAYRVFVRQDCDGLNTTFSNNSYTPANITTLPGCGSAYTDLGGATGVYPNNINGTAGEAVLCPTNAGDKVIVTFSSFQVESNWDPLYVFNGPSIASPIISSGNGAPITTPNLGAGGWWGTVAPTNTGSPGVVLSTDVSGCLTFRHISDASVQQAGWTASIACLTPHYTCAAAGTIACGEIKQGFTSGGTNTLPGTACPFNGAASNSGVSWWTYTALTTEEVTASLCNLAAFNTRVSIFHAPAADCTVLNCIGMNDDSPGCSSFTSEVTFAATAGETYYIAVHGSGTATGTFLLSVTCAPNCAPASANDMCATAAPIAPALNDGFGVFTTGDNTCAYVEAGTSCSGTGPVSGVWYGFNSGANTNMEISLLDVDINAIYSASALSYALFDGACGGLLASGEVACDATGEGYDQPLPALLANTNYKLLVYNAGGIGTEGTFGLLLEYPAADDAGISDIIAPDGLVCTTSIEGQVTLTNYGANPLTTVDILYSVDLGPQQTFNWVGLVPLGFNQSITVQLPPILVTQGPHTYEATVANPNGQVDGIPGNNASSSSFNSSGEAVTIVINQDRWGSETTWEIYDALEIAPIATGGPYTDLPFNGTQFNSSTHCLPTDFGNCFTLRVLDSFGDGMCCLYGIGTWQVRSTGGDVLLSDVFHGSGTLGGSAIYDGDQSPAVGANPTYSGHEFCLPKGPSDIETTECNILTNTLSSKVYTEQAPGTGRYQFEFSNPDQAFRRRISVAQRYVKFSQMQTQPLVAGTIYFARARRDAANDGYFNDNWGSGCDMALDISVISGCGQLINDVDLPTHSCGVTRRFGYSDKVWAQPVYGATQYRFKFEGLIDPDGPNNPGVPAGGARIITQSSYVRVLNWFTSTLVDGQTYTVTVEVFVNGVWSGFCGPACALTIDNTPAFGGRDVETTENDVQLYPNPVRDGNVTLVLNGLSGTEENVLIDIYDMFGKRVFNQSIGTEGATQLNTVLELGTSMASGIYVVDITMGDRRSVQRLTVQ